MVGLFFYAVAQEAGPAVMWRTKNALAIVLMSCLCVPMEAASKPVLIHGQGCVSQGVDARCLVVRDVRAGKLYNLIFTGILPAIGEGIEFEAVPHRGSVVCLQGMAFDVTVWAKKDSLRCNPKGAPKKK